MLNEYKERQLDPGKELNIDVLDSMVSALNDLKIVDVLKKPTELTSALREGIPLESIKPDASMQATGFYMVSMPDLKRDIKQTKVQLLSNEGDIQLRLKDGIVYNLRFGDLTGTESEIATENSTDAESATGVNRYLFITAEFDPAIISQPELEPVPEDATEKEAVEKANLREQERYDGELESGKKRAAELSDRFAGWYFVIAEDVYKRIHLSDANVFRTKTSDDEPPPGNLDIPGVPHFPELDMPPTPPSADHLPDLPGVGNNNNNQ